MHSDKCKWSVLKCSIRARVRLICHSCTSIFSTTTYRCSLPNIQTIILLCQYAKCDVIKWQATATWPANCLPDCGCLQSAVLTRPVSQPVSQPSVSATNLLLHLLTGSLTATGSICGRVKCKLAVVEQIAHFIVWAGTAHTMRISYPCRRRLHQLQHSLDASSKWTGV